MGELLSNIHPLESGEGKKKKVINSALSLLLFGRFWPLRQQVRVDEWCGSCNQQLSDTGGANHQSRESPS